MRDKENQIKACITISTLTETETAFHRERSFHDVHTQKSIATAMKRLIGLKAFYTSPHTYIILCI